MAFLLPCPACERKLVVTTGQAGGQVRCGCGADVAVPTVRALRTLPEAPAETSAKREWTAQKSVVLLGAIIAIAGGAFTAWMHIEAERTKPVATFADDIRGMQPAESWSLWAEYFRVGVGTWQPKQGVQQQMALRTYHELRRWRVIGMAIAGLGAVLVIVGLTALGPRRAASARPTRRPAAPNEPR